MTLYDLLKQARDIEYRLTSTQIPLKMHNCEIGIELELKDGYVDVKLKRKPISVEEFKSIIDNQKPQAQIGNVVISDKQDRESKKW